MMDVPDIFFLILPFLFLVVASASDARLAVAMYLLAAVSALLGVAFPYLASAASGNYWFGFMYLGIGMVSAVMSLITISEYRPLRR
jgi:hypothetical protein